ncbi:MAG: L,D-transpeptidase [Chthoniobacteraceae bacterium]
MTQPRDKTAPFGLQISIPRQRLELVETSRVTRSYPVSTSRFGLGSEPGSFKTPLGRFRVAEKIGAGAELGMIFKSRAPVGRIGSPLQPDDFVQTRILWLDGLDAHNANTHDRYIYIHGTNQEPQLGLPVSHGCIRMGNAEVAELFELVPEGCPVVIDLE